MACESVMCRRLFQHTRLSVNLIFQYFPYYLVSSVTYFLCAFNSLDISTLDQSSDDKRLKEFNRHLLRKSALMHFEFRPHNNDRTTRIVDPLTEQVLPESTALPFQHITEGFQRTVVIPYCI